MKFIVIFLVTNQSQTNFNVGRKSSTALSHIYRVLYLSKQRILRNSFITHFLSFLSIRNKIKYQRTSINSFNTYFFGPIVFRNELCWRRRSIDTLLQISRVLQQSGTNFIACAYLNTFFHFCGNQEQSLTFHHLTFTIALSHIY